MTKPTTNRYPFTLAAGDDIRPQWSADFIRFDTLPAGLLVGWNGAVPQAQLQGSQISGPEGENSLAEVVIKNNTGGALSGVLIYGRGTLRVEGVAALTGAVPLPTGAATEATLATLAAAGVETARGTVVSNATTAFNGKKSVSVANRSSSTGNVTVTFPDASTVVLLPGEGQSWSVSDRLNTLTDISVTSPDATTYALVAHTA